ncbi:class I SAM-dependent DNA methyltransferase [Roseococcus thiosulfatophilus]|uniref:class I SAM-dependent DNA methyltransferase n=1 Tax=Roseococcus thiosulfatophilus TaxID=35813 RepID=UPI001A8DB6DF|nr:class I SAM-dependent methyltransferase [Roseococcus thiosulfatophilus]
MSSPADDILRLYDDHAAAFARLRSQALFERGWLDAFMDAMPPSGREVLDLGCGTGLPLAAHLAARGCRITGLDGAPAMIAAARRNLPDHRWLLADMREPPALGPFHGLLAWHSFFHLAHDAQRRMFPVFARLAHAGAALMFTSGPGHGEALGEFEGRPLYHASLDAAEYKGLLATSGFELLRHVREDPSCGGATVWLARKGLPAD